MRRRAFFLSTLLAPSLFSLPMLQSCSIAIPGGSDIRIDVDDDDDDFWDDVEDWFDDVFD